MPITDVFKGQRGGISVGGKLEGGAVKVGTSVRVMPSNETGTVRSIEVDGATATLARAGDTADLTLAGWHVCSLLHQLYIVWRDFCDKPCSITLLQCLYKRFMLGPQYSCCCSSFCQEVVAAAVSLLGLQ